MVPFTVADFTLINVNRQNNSIINSEEHLNQQFDFSFSELISKVNSSLLAYYIENIQSFGPHPTGSSSIEEVKQYLFNELSKLPIDVSLHSWNSEGNSGENIVATLQGTITSNNVFITTAHYDTLSVSPGADDDGSGIAAILMMSSILSQYSFDTTIKFILFSGEEQGCLGSYEYAKEAKENNVNIIGVLALDKIGYAKSYEDGSIIRHHADPASSWMIDLTENISKKYMNEIELTVSRFPFDSSSDHKAFVDQGFSGSNFAENTLNPYYHTSEDLLKHMNLSYLSKVCKLTICTIASVTNGYSNLSDEDIHISILGEEDNEYDARISVIVENKKYPTDTANLSITIEMNHILRDTPVILKKEYYQVPCIWNFFEEVNQNWMFHIGPQTYSIGFFILTVSIHGMYDDFPVSIECSTYGMIFPGYNLLILPKSIN
jgi:hypothetical protein